MPVRKSKKSTTKRSTGAKRSTASAKRTARKATTAKSATKRSSASAAAKKTGARKSTARRSSATASAGRPTAARTTVRAKTARRSPNAAFMAPVQPDATLSRIVGSQPIPRTQVTKKLWAYIKRNDLQDPTQRRMINADPALTAVFGGRRRVDMFQMTKFVSQHLITR
ncbi:MAG: hypothetical protein HOP29_04430 [Phycisphaerales bacterium]|nr:hypothetical protein [Phycisphaerales bacterium]